MLCRGFKIGLTWLIGSLYMISKPAEGNIPTFTQTVVVPSRKDNPAEKEKQAREDHLRRIYKEVNTHIYWIEYEI